MQALALYNQTVENIIDGWIAEKLNSKSGSKKTEKAYRDTITSFRARLQHGGIDLDSDDVQTIKQVAEIWAGTRSLNIERKPRHTGKVSPSTYNQRLAILSSFYTYVQEQMSQQGNTEYINPIKLIKKRKVQAYADAAPLDVDVLSDQLLDIDRNTTQGKRDYALIAIGLLTGRRAGELVSLRMQHVKFSGKKITLHFDHCKGGKKKRDTLDSDTASVFLEYLHAVYGADLFKVDNDAPVWVSLSPRNKGQAISTYTLADICEKHLGISKAHALRHTFAVESEKAGAPISEISARLGHSSEKITGTYLKQARSADNPYAGKLAARFGIGAKKS